MAVSSTVFALNQHNILEILRDPDTVVELSPYKAGTDLRQGYFSLAFRLLEDQGFVSRTVSGEEEGLILQSTPKGREWLPLTSIYNSSLYYLELASSLRWKEPDISFTECSLAGFQTLPELEQRVLLHVAGPLIAAFLVHLCNSNLISATMDDVILEEIGLEEQFSACCLQLLENLGWILCHPNRSCSFTGEGKQLFPFIPQLFYPVSYLKTAMEVPELIFPSGQKKKREKEVEESHIDRNLDIRFSGLVYERNFREPVHAILERLFNNEQFSEQPHFIVDTGSGDGSLLLDVYRTIATHTQRGKYLDQFPLAVIGVEYNAVAEEATAAKLKDNKIPFFTMQGDISQPEKIASALIDRGIRLDDVLHVSKSVIHNRIYKKAEKSHDLGDWIPRSEAVFIDSDGTLLTDRELALNLVEHFKRWRKLVRKHGMVVIEAHAVPPALIASSVGQNILTSLDSSHGYSHQYLVEKDFFYKAAEVAGYLRETIMERSVPGIGLPVLTVNIFRSEE